MRRNKTAQITPARIEPAGIRQKKNENAYKLNPDVEIIPNKYPIIADIKNHKELKGDLSDKILK